MADVRLTATNPENSQAVPVACNAKGELLLESPEGSGVQLNDNGDQQTITSAGLGLSDGSDPDWAGGFFNVRKSTNNWAQIISIDSSAPAPSGLLISAGVDSPAGGAALLAQKGQPGLGGTSTYDAFQVDWLGNATFKGDVVIGSRNQQWMIVESNGLAHLVAQTFFSETAKEGDSQTGEVDESNKYPQLRNIPGELTMIEEQLQKVMEFLRMVPEAGWEVWDGAD